MASSQDSVPSILDRIKKRINGINSRIESTDSLKKFDVYLADSALFVYPTFMHSDLHRFDLWNKPLIQIIVDHAVALVLWIFSQIGRFTGIYLARPMTYQEKINFRELRAWSLTILVWIALLIFPLLFYIDDPQLFDLIGSPYYRMGNSRIVVAILGLFGFEFAAAKSLFLIQERKHQVEALKILERIMSPRRGLLFDRYWKKIMRRMTPIICCCFAFPWILCFGYLIFHVVFTIEIFKDPNFHNENFYFNLLGMNRFLNLYYYKIFMFFSLGFFGTFAGWYGVNTLICGFSLYYLSQKYLEYRFKQLNLSFQYEGKRKRFDKIMLIINEHNYLVGLNERNKLVMNIVLFINYLGTTPLLDLILHQSVYLSDNILYIKYTFAIIFIVYFFFFYLFAFSSTCLYISAHSLYKPFNSLIVKSNNISRRRRLTMSFYLERFSGPAIATWCWNLFPLTSYEFYIFISLIARSFFLIVSLVRGI